MKYKAELVNYQGCVFDSGSFNSVKTASQWAKGRGPCKLNLYTKKNTESHLLVTVEIKQ